MEVIGFRLGDYRTNCYLIHDTKKAWIIDPGFDGARVARKLQSLQLEPQAIYLTHTHWDHVLGLPGLVEVYGSLPLMVHPTEASFLGHRGGKILRDFALAIDPRQAHIPQSLWESIPEATHLYEDNEILEESGLRVIHTPGHSPGSVSLYHEGDGILFSGDTLFMQSIGRTDLPNSTPEAIFSSITDRLFVLPDDTRVYPGHGPATTIGKEKTNPWFD